MKRYFGCHVSVSGGLANGILNGTTLGVNTIQIHPSPPQRWNIKPFDQGVEAEFLELQASSDIEKVFLHAIYLINLANPDKQKAHLAKMSLVHYLDLCSRLKGEGVVFHVGSNKDQENEAEGLKQAADSINWTLDQANNDASLLLEVSAGSGKVIGSRMEQLETIYSQVEQKERVKFALDTQHMWASGYDFSNELDKIVSEIDGCFGLEKVSIIHLNDSKSGLASKVDRHANLGEGQIGSVTLEKIVQHSKLTTIPLVLETPGLKDIDSAKEEIKMLRKLIGLN